MASKSSSILNLRKGKAPRCNTALARSVKSVAGAIVLLGDQPQVTPEVINRLHRGIPESAQRSFSRSTAELPAIRSCSARTVFSELLAITGDRGARDVIQQKRDAVLRVPFPDLPVPLDVDTDEDYARLQAAWSARPATDTLEQSFALHPVQDPIERLHGVHYIRVRVRNTEDASGGEQVNPFDQHPCTSVPVSGPAADAFRSSAAIPVG